MAKYQRPQQHTIDPYKSQPLPIGRPVAVYYRQSSEGQIGNISTTLQTVDMVEHLIRQGWARENIIMIDMDAGISGAKKINERPGMSRLYEMIERGEIGLAAAQDVDRFFRDLTQIETNIFIDVCRRNNVQVLTPTFVYDFAHPNQGRYHMQLFREQAQRAADFIEYHVKGRLLKSRSYMSEQGMWMGPASSLGYMVDERTHLRDGSRNPHWRKYVPYQPHADVVVAYFQLFQKHKGNFKRTWEHIEQHGPFIPEVGEDDLPQGFKISLRVRTRSRTTGQLVVSRDGLHNLLQNVHYIGYWTHRNVIVDKYNHEPIVPYDLFMYAFNKLSKTDFHGDPNPDHIPYRLYNRHDKTNRQKTPPTYSGVLYSNDLPDTPMRRLNSVYSLPRRGYDYRLVDPWTKVAHLCMACEVVDSAVDEMLKERLRLTAIDEATWQTAIESTQASEHSEVRRIEQSIRNADRNRQNILDNLKTISHPEIVKNLEASYIATENEIVRLQTELELAQQRDQSHRVLLEVRPVVELILSRWSKVPADKRRQLFDAFAQRILISKLDMIRRTLVVEWRDGTQSQCVVQTSNAYFSWSPTELAKLKELVESNADQIDILRAFAGVTWENIQQRYAYHFGNRRWPSTYTGKRKYTQKTRWEDTTEFKITDEPPQISAMLGSS